MINHVAQHIPQLVQQEIIRQLPEIGIEFKTYGGKWEEEKG
jgi:hypothetical protein